MQDIASDLSGSYALTQDIDCQGFNFTPIGTGGNPFTGSLTGNSYSINNLTLNNPGLSYQALFAYTDGATLTNFTLKDFTINALNYAAALAGSATNTDFGNLTFENIDTTGVDYVAAGVATTNNSNFNNITLSNIDISGDRWGAALIADATQNVDIDNITINDIDVYVEEYSAGLCARVYDNSELRSLDLTKVNIHHNGAPSLQAGVIAELRDSNVYGIKANDITVNSPNTLDNLGGIVASMNNSDIEDADITEVTIVSHTNSAGFVGTMTNLADLNNCHIKDLTITSHVHSAGFAAHATNNADIVNCSVEDLDLTTLSTKNAGFISVLDGSSEIDNCYLKNAELTFNNSGCGGFAYQDLSGSSIKLSYLEDILINGNATDYIGGFINIHGSLIEECFVNNLEIDLPSAIRVTSFVQYMNSGTIRRSYVKNAVVRASNLLGSFARVLLGNASIDECYWSVELDTSAANKDAAVQALYGSSTLTDTYYNASLNPGLNTSTAAMGLSTSQMNDLSNFTNFDPAYWFIRDGFPQLKNIDREITSADNYLTVDFKQIYAGLPKDFKVSQIKINTEFDSSDFSLKLSGEQAQDFYIKDSTLYTSKVLNHYSKSLYDLKITALNSGNQYINHNFQIKVLALPNRISPIIRDEEEQDEISEEKLEQEREDLLNCEAQIKNFFNLADNYELNEENLTNLIMWSHDQANQVDLNELDNVLSCADGYSYLAENIEQDLDTLHLNKRGRLNFKSFEDYVKRFKRQLKVQDDLSCTQLSYDTNNDCRLTREDFENLKQYFKISISQRSNNSEKILRRLKSIERSKRLRKFISL